MLQAVPLLHTGVQIQVMSFYQMPLPVGQKNLSQQISKE